MTDQKQSRLNLHSALKQLLNEHTPLSARLVGALTGASKADLAHFAQTWMRISIERRRRIAQQMVELAEHDFKLDFEILFRYMLDDEDATVRASSIEGLWESEDPALVKPMIGFLRSDPDARVRAAAADALGRLILLGEYGRLKPGYAERIGEALLATTRSSDEDLTVRCRAIEALAYWSNDIVSEIIQAAYEDDAPEMRASALAAMGRTADADWAPVVQDELESPDDRMRFEAARACGELQNRQATPRLMELLDDPDREVQGAAITALGQIGGKQAKAALTQAAQSEDSVLSELALDALQELEFVDGSELLLFDMPTERDLEEESEEDWNDDDTEEDSEGNS